MIKRGVEAVARTWLSGLLVLMPLALTLAVLAWAFSVVNRLLGPGSLLGRLFSSLGYRFSTNPSLQYAIGTLVLVAGIYLLGLLVQAGLRRPLQTLTARTMRRIPILGAIYNLAERFAGLLDRDQKADIGAMSPVWCVFGGEGVAVLGLAPGGEPVEIDGRRHVAVLLPTAPVPFSGALLYVPLEWVRPAHIGVDELTAIYVSLGITSPSASPRGARPADPRRLTSG
ncbi:MAG TPA: DUF502 domain-containing protein [Candidatus Methylomirabilis sp.]|nr:DUF502 domain-containing protein [Candidatus Methylomirabilis sp.]